MSVGLCHSCEYRHRVEAKEVGTVIDYCGYFDSNPSIVSLGCVTNCSAYSRKDLPYLFVRSAWIAKKDKNGVLRFEEPDKENC